ncbi:MAG: hypothetical protein EOO53_18540 [Gammaproteobacteria bacterium]|nr:MAG: hypothetical protein EOO53_18540 [Gammaproteobacteria bacterium]
MRRSIFIGTAIIFFSFGCATQTNYNLHGFYKSKNNSFNLVSKLAIYKSGSYIICTSTYDHEKENPNDGNYRCVEGVWKQQKNKVTLIANTYEGELLFLPFENESIPILKRGENLANPTILSILQPSGATMSDISATDVKGRKINSWGNYQHSENF